MTTQCFLPSIRSDGFLNGSKSSGWTGKPLPPFKERMNDAKQGYIADVALIHIGTNDPDSTAALVEVTKSNIISIINVLRERNPRVQVFLAKMITGWKDKSGNRWDMYPAIN